jgi:hypothetical protein
MQKKQKFLFQKEEDLILTPEEKMANNIKMGTVLYLVSLALFSLTGISVEWFIILLGIVIILLKSEKAIDELTIFGYLKKSK